MSFDEKVKFLRTLPQFKVIPLNEVRAVAFAAKENDNENAALSLTSPASTRRFRRGGPTNPTTLTLSSDDIAKITREYPDLEAKLT